MLLVAREKEVGEKKSRTDINGRFLLLALCVSLLRTAVSCYRLFLGWGWVPDANAIILRSEGTGVDCSCWTSVAPRLSSSSGGYKWYCSWGTMCAACIPGPTTRLGHHDLPSPDTAQRSDKPRTLMRKSCCCSRATFGDSASISGLGPTTCYARRSRWLPTCFAEMRA